ncbi:MAG: carboxypeptidase regulatory-like domain-containing protein [Terracidiphilus sp.]|nr:carboxypeptidase regulatory-like domain-containing protein [Terracidiphilus sp.]
MQGWLVVALMCAVACAAQAQAVWQGLLRTASGAPIAGAKVMLVSAGARGEATTGADGRFALTALPAGEYRLTIETEGKRAEYAVPVELAAGAPAAVITLSSRGEITLATQAAAATGGEQLSSQAVSELPLNKRDFSSLLLLAAGTMTDTNGATNFTAQFAINGQRGVEATFAMDGADISDPEMGGSTFSNFNVDAVEGIDSSSGWLPAEIGRGAAGFTNIHTRSGASGFHGSVFEFVRNSAFDARNYFDHPTAAYPGRIPPFRRNEFGFTNGGPVWIPGVYDGRKRTFYFVEYQGFRQVLGTTQVMPVPTAAERPTSTSNIVQHTLTFADGSTDTLLVPVPTGIAEVLARYPLPNLPTGSYGANTYATASKVATNADQFSLRIDHKFSSKDQFLARFTMDNLTGPTTNPDQTAIDPAFGVQYLDRQRNVMGAYTRTQSPRLIFESLISITRTTPGFPTTDSTDPAVMFTDGLYEAFNTASGSVMQAYGNLFHGRQTVSYTTGKHAVHAGFEARINRDTTYFGTSPNGGYSFGGGTSYATESIASASGNHNVAVGDPLPDTLSSFLSGSPFAYSVALAASFTSGGEHIGPAAINREGYGAWVQDTWKITPSFTLDYGLRWELYTPITERARRTASFKTIDGVQQYVVNPQPGYQKQWTGWMPRVQATWQMGTKMTAHAGGSVMVIPANIWQDNFLTGSTPFVMYPRRVSSAAAPFNYGFSISPSQLPTTYTPTGVDIFASGKTNTVAPNTVMDVDRYEKDMAALTDSSAISPLNLSGIDPNFGNGRLYTWTVGLERKFGNMTADAAYVGTAADHLPRYTFPNGYPGATAEFAPHTQFDSAGNVTGGFGVENVITDDAHSSYHALQASLSGTLGHGGPGIQTSYTFSKSLDTASTVIGGTGSTGAVSSGFPQNPFDSRAEKGPSSFDVKHGFGLSVAQDLHMDKAAWLQPVSRKVTGGWELLSISSISSGSPFTVYAGVQETGAGSNGVDRPDQIAKPKLSTARKDRKDYFGAGAENGPKYFSIPVFVAGGTGPNQGRFGTLGRNTFRGPAYYNFDFALIKDTPFGRRKSGAERVDLQFRSEFFNLFNIVNMGSPSNVLGVTVNSTAQTAAISTTNGFGQISRTAGTSRQIQLSLKLIY